jgi:hypothetical protein
LTQWNEGKFTKRVDSQEARVAMQKIDNATKELRSCYTETAIQKGCIQVSLALIDLASKQCCYNPFLCLQQAAIFASQGSKSGNNDDPFKAALPEERECTAQEALVVIGRADCLQSLHFADEAVFLCNYVARVCRMHRDAQRTDMEWNGQWKVIGICLYNLSVAIRITRSFQADESYPEYFDESIMEELKRCRADAITIKSMLPEHPSLPVESDPSDVYLGNHRQDAQISMFDSYHDTGDDVDMQDVPGGVLTLPNGMIPASGAAGFGDDSEDEGREIVAI